MVSLDYLVFYDLKEKNTTKTYKKSHPVRVHDSQNKYWAAEIINDIKERLNEIEETEKYETFIEITNICLLRQEIK